MRARFAAARSLGTISGADRQQLLTPSVRSKFIIRPATPGQADPEARYNPEALSCATLLIPDRAELARCDARKRLGEANGRRSRKRHDAATWRNDLRAARVRSVFRDIDRTRDALLAARKALAELEAASRLKTSRRSGGRRSQRKLAALAPRAVCLEHGGSIVKDAANQLRRAALRPEPAVASA